MLQQPHSLRLHELVDHVAEHSPDGVEALVGVTDVREPGLVQQNLLHNEDGDCLGEFGARLHDAQAERDDFRGQKEVNNGVVIVLLE